MKTRSWRRVLPVVLVAALLGGCSVGLPTPAAPKDKEGAPGLDEQTYQRTLTDLEKVLAAADGKKDPKLLTSRVEGPALRMRTAQYQLAAKGGPAPMALPVKTIAAVTSTGTTWPRAAIDVSDAGKGKTPFVLVLKQDDARQNYRLWSWVSLFPGAELPKTPKVSVGAQLLPEDAPGLVATPKQAVADYVALLNDPGSKAAAKFELKADALNKTYREQVKGESDAFKDVGSVTRKAAPFTSDGVIAMSLVEEGALVAGTFTYTTVYKRTDREKDVSLSGQLASALDGNGKVVGTVTATYDVTVVFVVPPAGSKNKIRAIGADMQLRGASRDDAA